MAYIILYRTGPAPRKVAEATLNKRLAEVNKTARVHRDATVRFFLGGGFSALPVTRQSVIDSPIRREAEATGWRVPDTDLGRAGIATPEQAESYRLWVKKNLGIQGDTFAVIHIDGEEG